MILKSITLNGTKTSEQAGKDKLFEVLDDYFYKGTKNFNKWYNSLPNKPIFIDTGIFPQTTFYA